MNLTTFKWAIILALIGLALYLAVSAGKNIAAAGKEAMAPQPIPPELMGNPAPQEPQN